MSLALALANIGAATSAPFAPQNEAGFTMWLDPRLGVTTSSGHVTAWADQAGNVASFAAAGTHIVQGSSLNGHTSLDFSATDSYLSSATNISTVLTASAWTALVVFQYTGASAEGVNYYTNPFLVGDADNTYWGLTCSTTRLDAAQYDGAYKVDHATITTATNYYAVCKYDGTKIYTSLNGGAFDAGVAAGSIGSTAVALRVGKNNGGTVGFKGSVGDVVLFNQSLSDAAVARLQAGIRSRYGL